MGHKETREYVKSELNKGNPVPLERVRHALSGQLSHARVLGNEREVERKEEALSKGDIESLLANAEISTKETKGITPIKDPREGYGRQVITYKRD